MKNPESEPFYKPTPEPVRRTSRAQPPHYIYRLDYEKRFPQAPLTTPDLDAMAAFISAITRPR
jgi:hypothetical protein